MFFLLPVINLISNKFLYLYDPIDVEIIKTVPVIDEHAIFDPSGDHSKNGIESAVEAICAYTLRNLKENE